MKKLFTKTDYIRFTQHKEEHVKDWALENLIRFHPTDRETVEISLKLFQEESSDGFTYLILPYIQKHFELFPGDKLFAAFQALKGIDQLKAMKLAIVLAKKGYELENLEEEFTTVQPNLLPYYFSMLGEMQTEKAYQRLLTIFRTRKMDELISSSLINNLLKYKNPGIIPEILERSLESNLPDERKEFIAYLLMQQLAILCRATEFFKYLFDYESSTERMEEINNNLKSFWPHNKYVARFTELSTEFTGEFDKGNYRTTFLKLIKLIMRTYSVRYEFVNWVVDRDLVEDKRILSFQDQFKREDLCISLIIQGLLARKNIIFKMSAKAQVMITFMLMAMAIVALEEIDYDQAIERAKRDVDYLWEIFCSDREALPEEVMELVVEQGAAFEDRLIELVRKDQHSESAYKAIIALGRIRSKKAVPYLIENLDDDLGDMQSEEIVKALIEIGDIPLDILEENIMGDNRVRAELLCSVLSWRQYDESAKIMTEAWQKGIMFDLEELAYYLRNVGSKHGIEVLEEADDAKLKYCEAQVYETLMVLYGVNGVEQEKVERLKEKFEKL